jgi:hypothetical protein
MGIHLIVFAGEKTPKRFIFAAYNLKRLAQEFDLFDTIKIVTNDTLAEDAEFNDRHQKFIAENSRGYGYWIWKPYIIYKYLEKLKDDDILLYCDACVFLNIHGKERLLDYIHYIKRHPDGNLFFEYGNTISHWCKMDLIAALDAKNIMNEKEIVPTVFFTTANAKNRAFFKLWYDIMCDYHLIDDSPSVLPNVPEFVEHRHDQSVFSLLVRQHLPDTIKNCPSYCEVQFTPTQTLKWIFPIWIKQNLFHFDITRQQFF